MKLLFVHGACVIDGAWWWHRMVAPLARFGLRTEAVELPSCGPAEGPAPSGDLYADVNAVRTAASGGPVILVSSSYGGMVSTAAAEGLPNVEHLVYLSSVLPDATEPLASLTAPDSPGWLEPAGDNTVRLRTDLSEEEVCAHFLQDCDSAATQGALSRLGRQRAVVFDQPPGHAAWRHLPSTAVICTEDRATAPRQQQRWAARAGRTVELASGHHPFLSRPTELARLLAEVAH